MNESNLIESFPISLNETVMFFMEKGYEPDKYGYLCKRNKYIKIVENGVSIVDKSKLWDKKGVAINENVVLLHIAD